MSANESTPPVPETTPPVPETTPPVPDSLVMFRPTLALLPPLDLPKGITLRHYKLGDEQIWDTITKTAFNDQTRDFEKDLRSDVAFCPERVLFLEDQGKVVATASAWRKQEFGPDCGYVHWVGVLPESTGNHLGYWMTLAVLHRFAIEGCCSAVLHTQDYRLPAIKIYLQLGFTIDMTHPTLPKRWNAIVEKLANHKK